MTAFIFENFINTTLAGALTTGSTSMTLSSSSGLPASIPTGYVMAFILNDAATRQNYEIVYATAVSGATLTIERAQEGTAALSWATNDYVFSMATAGQMEANASGRLLNVQILTSSGTYTPATGTNVIIVEMVGGGGGGGGCPSLGANQQATAGGGFAGAYAKVLLTSGFSGVSFTIGTAGTGGASGSNAGTPGGATSFGSLISCPGGSGGYAGAAAGSSALIFPVTYGSSPTISSGYTLKSLPASPGLPAIVLGTSSGQALSGSGGSSPFGTGGGQVTGNHGIVGSGYGAGGSGASQLSGFAGAAGGNGSPGVIIVYEFS